MKTSNKILVGLVLGIALILTGIHVALYAKYKKGEFYTMESLHEEAYDKHLFNGVSKISISGLQTFEIVPSDTLLLEIEKQNNNNNIVRFVQKGDSLVIAGDTAVRENDGSIQRLRSYQSVILHIPSNIVLYSDNSAVSVKGAKDTLKLPVYNFQLSHSEFNFGETRNGKPDGSHYGSINAVVNNSNVLFFNDVMIGTLSLSLVKGETEDQGMQVEKFSLNADSSSAVNLKGVNLKKIVSVTKQ